MEKLQERRQSLEEEEIEDNDFKGSSRWLALFGLV